MIGELVSHYKIIETIRSGGMGEVYRAEDIKLKRLVALKFLPHYLSFDDHAKRLLIQEAQTASSLQHNNICTIHEIGETEDGQLFICMDLYSGKTLDEKIKNGSIELRDAIKYIIQIAEGLNKAHQNNIVHRDIKPSNIFITNDEVVKILDFGLVKVSNHEQLIRDGSQTGTIAYMSPEQAIGEEVDFKSDIWSLGVVLYEMITGKRPFDGIYNQEIIYSILNEEPKSFKEIGIEVPDELENILSKMLFKEKQGRLSSLTDLITWLKKIFGIYADNERNSFYKLKYFALFISSITLIVIIAVVALNDYTSHLLDPQKKSISVFLFDNQTGDTSYNYLTIAVPNLIITNLEQSELFNIMSWERLHDLLKQTGTNQISQISNEVAFDLCMNENIGTLALGSITKAGNYFATNVKLFDVNNRELKKTINTKGEGVESILLSQIDILSEDIVYYIADVPKDKEALSQTITELTTISFEAYYYYLKGNDKFASLNWDSAVNYYLKAIENDSNFAMAYNNLSVCYSYLNKYDEMRSAIEKALLLSEKISDKEKLFIHGQYEILIEQNYLKALDIYTKLNKRFPKDKRILMYKVFCNNRVNGIKKTIGLHKELLTLDKNYATSLNALGYFYLFNGNLDSSKYYFNSQMDAYPDEANSYDALGDFYLINRNLKTARNYYNKCMTIGPNFLETKLKFAYSYALEEDFEMAKKIMREEVSNREFQKKSTSLSILSYYEFLTRNYKKSLKTLNTARKLATDSNDKISMTYINLLYGWISLEQNNDKLAEIYFEEYNNSLQDSTLKEIESFIHLCFIDLNENINNNIESNISKIKSLLIKLSPNQIYYHKNRIERLLLQIRTESVINNAQAEIKINISEQDYIPTYFHFDGRIIRENLPFQKDFKARYYAKMKKNDKAITEYEKLLNRKIQKNIWLINPIYHYRIAQLYEEQKEYIKAITEYKTFCEICRGGEELDTFLIKSRKKILELQNFI